MAGTKNKASERPPALTQDRGDEGGSTTQPSASGADDYDVEPQEAGLCAVASAFAAAVVAHHTDVTRALRDQWTRTAANDIQRYAEQRARMVRHSGRPCPRPSEYARELVQDAYTDTWVGDLAWDPQRCSLVRHLRTAIKTRTRKEIEKAPRYVSLDAKTVNENHERGVQAAIVESLFAPSGDVSSVLMPALVARVCHELQQATLRDRACVALVDAWQRGLVERDEIMKATGLNESAYDRARKRLVYASADLTSELRQLVQDCLRRAR
ncbi:MAG: hypothetical protein ACTHU0_10320 [Kofleriaceae bacterium]